MSPRATASARDGIVPFKIRVLDDVLHECHDLLGDGDGHLVCADLLRIARRRQRRGTEYRSSTGADACALFPKEISVPPRRWVEARYHLTRWTEMPRGGHFAALEEPGLLVEDVRAFFRDLRP